MMRKLLLYLTLLITPVSEYAEIATTSINFKEAKEAFLEAKNAKLFYKTIGKGKPLIVIHGGPGLSQDYLLPQLYRLADNNLVIFYDQRGCGKSTGEINPETITVEAFVNDLDTIRKAFQFEKISILGHSWGGFLAMQYAIAHPECIYKLILSNSMPASSDEFALFLQEYVHRTSPYQTELAGIHNTQGFLEGDPDIIERLYRIIFRTYCYLPENADKLSLRMTSTASVNGAKVSENFRKNVFEKPFNLHASLKSLKIPTLVIHGDSDPIPAFTAQNVHKSIPQSKYILMKNCGHFPYVEDPNIYFNHLNEFLNDRMR